MAERGSLTPWPDPPPGRTASPGTRAWAVIRRLQAGGWLRPRRIGCLLLVLLVLVFAVLWVVGSTVNQITATFGPEPIHDNPMQPLAPAPVPPSSGSPTIDRVEQDRLYVAIQEIPQLAARSPGSPTNYDGFDVAVAELIAAGLGADPADTVFKPIPPSRRDAAVNGPDADIAIGGYEITPQRRSGLDVVGPYLVSDLRLAVPADSPVTGLDSLGDGVVGAPRDSSAAAELSGLLGERLVTRASLGSCANLLGRKVGAIAGNDIALRALPASRAGELRMVGEPLGTTEYGIGLPAGDEVLRERIATVLREIIGNGTWAGLYAEHLGTPVPPVPQPR